MTKFCKVTMAASLLTGIWVTGAQADDERIANCPPRGMEGPPPGPPGGPGFHGGPRFGRFIGPGPMSAPLREADLNKDGRITHGEIDQSLKARLTAADANRDGTLDAKEFESARPKPPEGAPPPPPPPGAPFGGPEQMFKRSDWNGDGKLTLDEFSNPIRNMASHIDRNADGIITQDELEGPPGPPPGPPPR